jgi:3-hydroxyisobutyrate dehydrogenase-like beta-hydroxyacid dehydrogenase
MEIGFIGLGKMGFPMARRLIEAGHQLTVFDTRKEAADKLIALGVIGKVFFIGEKPGSAQTMKLANNFLSATAMVATSEAVVMGVKSGLDPAVMIDVINAGSGMNTASRDKFPRAVLPRSFDFGFATGLMVKDVRLCLEEMKSLGLSMEVAEAVGRLWEVVIRDMGAESDFTSAIKPIEKAAGVVVGGAKGGSHAAK